jgi:hypothetical protein
MNWGSTSRLMRQTTFVRMGRTVLQPSLTFSLGPSFTMSLSRDLALGLSAGVLLAHGLPALAAGANAWLSHAPPSRVAEYAFPALSVPVAAFALTSKPYAIRITYVLLILLFLRDLSPIIPGPSNPFTATHVVSSFAAACLYLLCLISLYLSRRQKPFATDNE